MLYNNSHMNILNKAEIEIRKVVVYKKPLKDLKRICTSLSKKDLQTVINRSNHNTNLTILNMSLSMDKTYDRKYITFLLQNGADPNLEFPCSTSEALQKSFTPLMMESKYGTVKNISVLIQYGGNIYKKDINGKDALDHAIEGCNTLVIRKLKKKKRQDYNKVRNTLFKHSNLNEDCVKDIVSFIM